MATDVEPKPAGDGAAPPPSLLSGQSGPLAGDAPRKLSDDLAAILREFEVETVTLREVMAVLHGRGFLLLIMLLALPFSVPLPLPGLSTPFGFVIALIGLRLVLGQKPWLPARLLDTELSPTLFVRVFTATRKIILLGKSSKETMVREIMTEKVLYALPEQTTDQAMALMTEKHIRHLPVLNAEKRVIGMVSIGDLVKETISEQAFLIKQLEQYIAS